MVFSASAQYDEARLQEIIAPQRKCMALEKLLFLSDEIDLAILHGLLTDLSLTEIASRLYLTRDAIKYRVRKFKERMKCESVRELAAFIKRWIDPAKLEDMLIGIRKA